MNILSNCLPVLLDPKAEMSHPQIRALADEVVTWKGDMPAHLPFAQELKTVLKDFKAWAQKRVADSIRNNTEGYQLFAGKVSTVLLGKSKDSKQYKELIAQAFVKKHVGDVMDPECAGQLHKLFLDTSKLVAPSMRVKISQPKEAGVSGAKPKDKEIPFNVLVMIEAFLKLAQHLCSIEGASSTAKDMLVAEAHEDIKVNEFLAVVSRLVSAAKALSEAIGCMVSACPDEPLVKEICSGILEARANPTHTAHFESYTIAQLTTDSSIRHKGNLRCVFSSILSCVFVLLVVSVICASCLFVVSSLRHLACDSCLRSPLTGSLL